ncbi:MAG TPA: hypothetical protein VD884_12455 [Ohtaekwangia sp.]|nr:hypothetical protein [Ohtaekwangia sp.]
MARQFVETRTKEFINYFRNESLLTDIDLDEWAKTVAAEIEISSSEREREELKMLTERMKLNCEKCDERQIKAINDFINRVERNGP